MSDGLAPASNQIISFSVHVVHGFETPVAQIVLILCFIVFAPLLTLKQTFPLLAASVTKASVATVLKT